MEGEMKREDVVKILVSDNPERSYSQLVIYADAFLEYRKAEQEIAEQGVIVAHPRTGAPLENPFVKIRDAAARRLNSDLRIDGRRLWKEQPTGKGEGCKKKGVKGVKRKG